MLSSDHPTFVDHLSFVPGQRRTDGAAVGCSGGGRLYALAPGGRLMSRLDGPSAEHRLLIIPEADGFPREPEVRLKVTFPSVGPVGSSSRLVISHARNSPNARRTSPRFFAAVIHLGKRHATRLARPIPSSLPIPQSVLGRNIGRKEFKMFEIVCPQLMTGASSLQPDRQTEARIVRANRDSEPLGYVFSDSANPHASQTNRPEGSWAVPYTNARPGRLGQRTRVVPWKS